MYMYVKSVNVQSHVPHTTLLFQFQFFLFGTVRTKCRTLKHKEQAQRQTKNRINYTTLMSCISKYTAYYLKTALFTIWDSKQKRYRRKLGTWSWAILLWRSAGSCL